MQEEISGPSFFIGRGNGDDEDLISFGSGQPDLPPPPEAYEVIKDYRGFRYGLVQGAPALREALAEEYPSASPENFVITNGASEAIDLTLRAIAVPGGKVMLPRPYYYSYPHNVCAAGMEPIYYDLDAKGKIDITVFTDVLEQKNGDVRAVMINSPSNPTGTIQELETLQQIEKLCAERGIYIISDEVYKELIYVRENYLMQGPHVVTVNSFSKTYAMCGLRVGYLFTHDSELIQQVVELKSHSSMNTSIIGQAMALGAIQMKAVYVDQHLPIWKERRDLIYNGLRELGFELMKPEGAFYVLPKIQNPNRAMHDLYYNYHMVAYDGNWFGAPDSMRLSYALETERIEEGLKRLKQFLEKEYQTY